MNLENEFKGTQLKSLRRATHYFRQMELMVLFLSEILSLSRKGKNYLNEFAKISTNFFGEEALINKNPVHEINISMFTLGKGKIFYDYGQMK